MGKLLDKIKEIMDLKGVHERLDENFENGSQVAAALAPMGTKVGQKAYFMHKNAKRAYESSPRDIIRNDIGFYPYKVVENSLKNKYERAPYLLRNGKGETYESDEPIDKYTHPFAYKKNGDLRKGWSVVDNRADFRKDFDSAVNSVRERRNYESNYKLNGDISAYKRARKDLKDFGKDSARSTIDTHKKFVDDNYKLFDWNGYVAARKASKEQGQKLGRMFARQNAKEKQKYAAISGASNENLYTLRDPNGYVIEYEVPESEISTYEKRFKEKWGNGYEMDKVLTHPKSGKPKVALGGQNAQYLENSLDIDSPQSVYEIEKSAKPIHYDKDGNPYVRGFTWTQTGNIPKITDPNSGYLATVGADTKVYHPHIKGQWTSEGWGNPMDKNYENHVAPGEVRGLKNFDEQLLETRWPLKFYQKAPFINQGGTQERVTVMGAGPGAKDVHRPIVGKDGIAVGTTVDPIATPSSMITAHMEDNMPSEWTMHDRYNGGKTIAGWHPNKKWSDMNAEKFAEEVRKLNPELYKEISKAYEDEYGLVGMELAANGPKFVGRWFLENPDKLDALKQSKVSDISRVMERNNELSPQYALIDRARANSLLDKNPSTPYEYSLFADNLPSRDVFAKGSMYRGEKPYTFSRTYDETPNSVMDFYKQLEARKDVLRSNLYKEDGRLDPVVEDELGRLDRITERIEEDYGW